VSTQYFQIEGLYSQILQREEIGSTFFSKQIAVPHPMNAVIIGYVRGSLRIKEPIIWDEEKE
jgi:lichenan operon transcriptional antiterminator